MKPLSIRELLRRGVRWVRPERSRACVHTTDLAPEIAAVLEARLQVKIAAVQAEIAERRRKGLPV